MFDFYKLKLTILSSDWVYQPKPKRKRTTGTGVTSLFAVTVNPKGNNAVRHINTYKHTNSGLVFQQVAPPSNQEVPGGGVVQNNVQVLQGNVVQGRQGNQPPTIMQQPSGNLNLKIFTRALSVLFLSKYREATLLCFLGKEECDTIWVNLVGG